MAYQWTETEEQRPRAGLRRRLFRKMIENNRSSEIDGVHCRRQTRKHSNKVTCLAETHSGKCLS